MDLISRQTAIDAIWEHATKILENSDYDVFIQDIYKMAHRHIAELIKQLPSAQPEADEWCHDCKEYDKEHHCCPRWGQVIRTALEEAQPEQQWIPCSERPPKKDGRYQVTRHDYVTQTNFVDILWYEKGVWWNRQSIGDYAVTAWMPLPEPWREKNNG